VTLADDSAAMPRFARGPTCRRSAGRPAVEDFGVARRRIQGRAVAAQRPGRLRTVLDLHLERDSASTARRFLEALEAADALTAAGVLLVPPSSQATRDTAVATSSRSSSSCADRTRTGAPTSVLE
jgi:hypothetical protein